VNKGHFCFLTVFVAAVCTANADIVNLDPYIQNAGFEALTSLPYSCGPKLCSPTQSWSDTAPDWTIIGPQGQTSPGNWGGTFQSKAGTSSDPNAFDPTASTSPGQAFINPVAGQNVGWLQPGAFMFQTINLAFDPNDTYVLQYYVGRRYEQDSSNFQITATVGETTTAGPFDEGVNTFRLFGNTSTITPGGWELETLTFSNNTLASGLPITVWLGAEGAPGPGNTVLVQGTGQVDFDVPEPTTIALLLTFFLALGVVGAFRKRTA
jgi:hypothetical protein